MKTMKLWLVYPTNETKHYDTYDAMVVAATTEAEAKRIHPDKSQKWDPKSEMWTGRYQQWVGETWVESPDHVKARYLGRATTGTKAGIICASFRAG